MKSPYLIIIILAILGASTTAYSQENPLSKSLSIKLGNSSGLFKDSNFSPLNYKEGGMAYKIDFNQQTQSGNLFGVQLDFNLATLETKNIEHYTATYYVGSIAIEYLKKRSKEVSPKSLYVGGAFKTNNHIILYEGLESFTYLFNHSLSIKARYDWQQTDKLFFSTSLSIPVVNYLVRPPYNGFDKTTEAKENAPLKLITDRGKVTSFNKYIELDWGLVYRYSINERLSVLFDFTLTYQRYRGTQQFTRLNRQTLLGVSIALGKR